MRRAAEQDVLGDRQLRRRLGLLRDESNEARERAAPEPADVLPLDADLAIERDESGERAQRRRLPSAVRADERRPAAGFRAAARAHAPRRPARTAPTVARLDHRTGPRGAENDGEERRAEERGDDADRQLGRREERPRKHVREDEEAGPAKSESGITAR